jgi:hypothetical protein
MAGEREREKERERGSSQRKIEIVQEMLDKRGVRVPIHTGVDWQVNSKPKK